MVTRNASSMKQSNNYFKNGNKQLLKEGIAVLVVMLFLAGVGFGLVV